MPQRGRAKVLDISERCREIIWTRRIQASGGVLCSKRKGYGTGGKYCKQHADMWARMAERVRKAESNE